MAWWIKVAGTGESAYTQVESLDRAPALREIGVSPKSLRQHSHISLADAQGLTALELVCVTR